MFLFVHQCLDLSESCVVLACSGIQGHLSCPGECLSMNALEIFLLLLEYGTSSAFHFTSYLFCNIWFISVDRQTYSAWQCHCTRAGGWPVHPLHSKALW